MVTRESRFVAIFIGDFYFPVAAVSVQCRENRDVTKRFDSFVHVRYGIKFPTGYCV